MELEKEIQSKFENDYHKVVVNIIYTYGWMSNIIRTRIGKDEITIQQFNILRILRGQYPGAATINLLKARMLDKMSDASRIVERLVQKGLVTRTVNLKDRRSVDIVISQKGLELLKKLDPIINPIDVLKANLTETEATQLNTLLDKLRG